MLHVIHKIEQSLCECAGMFHRTSCKPEWFGPVQFRLHTGFGKISYILMMYKVAHN